MSLKASTTKIVVEDLSRSQFERLLGNTSKLAIVFVGFIVLLVVLQEGRAILAPVALAIVVGLMFGPVADWVERKGIRPSLSAAIVVVLFICIIGGGALLFAVPLSEWTARIPMIWEKLRVQLLSWQEPLEALSALQDQIKGVLGGEASMTVEVQDSSAVTNLAMVAPTMLAEFLVFLASLYFYVATRHEIQAGILSLCVTRALRWRTAHVFRDVEQKVSHFLLSITIINVAVGVAVGLGMWAIGMPSPLLWGALAAVLNYIPYVGQAIMVVILLAVGLGTRTGIEQILAPAIIYGAINFIEGQILTPQFMGRQLTLNPFMIFLSIAYWMWIWGPVGGLVAVPSLLIIQAITKHVLPSRPEMLVKRRTTRAQQAARQEVLDNAAELVKAKGEEQAAIDAEVKPSMLERILHPGDTEDDKDAADQAETDTPPQQRRRLTRKTPVETETATPKPAPRRRKIAQKPVDPAPGDPLVPAT